ncbi:uncharacterized protein LOC115967080 [Quercus lobata]|uniref:PGG domain-containing protein n=1 Tax=Quercus lobata TaxID=97700 RepID=A0A7N2N2I3_QUELO|nr:uncharacterized protein LOC115967080 [Quercus lobata]
MAQDQPNQSKLTLPINSTRSDADSINARARGDNSSEHTKNTLLVLGTLIASVTFQAGVNPTGGVWQENSPQDPAQQAGKTILANNISFYAIYIVCNTLAFSTSCSMIGSLVETSGEFRILVRLVLFYMGFTYCASVMSVLPNRGTLNTWLFLFTFYSALLVPFLPLFARRIWNKIEAAWNELW